MLENQEPEKKSGKGLGFMLLVIAVVSLVIISAKWLIG
ncbi:MAG: hypothetical protein FD123_2731 [Bacteroidetes bacterium]|nr:MAG: hypothetical protein FD123_2731 [Bacteroidota bacterium]